MRAREIHFKLALNEQLSRNNMTVDHFEFIQINIYILIYTCDVHNV